MCTCWAATACNMPWVMVYVLCVQRSACKVCVCACCSVTAVLYSTGPPGAQCTRCLCPAVRMLLPGGGWVPGTRASVPAVRHCQLQFHGNPSIHAPCNCLNHSWRGLCNPHTLLHAAHVWPVPKVWSGQHSTPPRLVEQVEVWPWPACGRTSPVCRPQACTFNSGQQQQPAAGPAQSCSRGLARASLQRRWWCCCKVVAAKVAGPGAGTWRAVWLTCAIRPHIWSGWRDRKAAGHPHVCVHVDSVDKAGLHHTLTGRRHMAGRRRCAGGPAGS